MSNKKSKLKLVEPAQDRLMDNTHCDQLSDMKSRIYALHLAICGVRHRLALARAGVQHQQLDRRVADAAHAGIRHLSGLRLINCRNRQICQFPANLQKVAGACVGLDQGVGSLAATKPFEHGAVPCHLRCYGADSSP